MVTTPARLSAIGRDSRSSLSPSEAVRGIAPPRFQPRRREFARSPGTSQGMIRSIHPELFNPPAHVSSGYIVQR